MLGLMLFVEFEEDSGGLDSFVFDADGEFSGVEEFSDTGIEFFAD